MREYKIVTVNSGEYFKVEGFGVSIQVATYQQAMELVLMLARDVSYQGGF